MAEIHPLAFLIVGMVVTAVSVFVGLTFFMYVGIIFMAWGLGKLSYRRLSEPRQLRRSGPVPEKIENLQAPAQAHYYVHCTRCGHGVRPTDAFCARCGLRRTRRTQA